MSDALRERVLAAMRELDYQPNAAARTLTFKRSNTIGLIVSDIRDPFFAALARGVEDLTQERGYTLVLHNSDENAEREEACLKALHTRQVDGLLRASAGVADAYLSRLVRAGFPIVLVDRDLPELGVPAILTDNAGGAYAAVRHLIARGHQRIAISVAAARLRRRPSVLPAITGRCARLAWSPIPACWYPVNQPARVAPRRLTKC